MIVKKNNIDMNNKTNIAPAIYILMMIVVFLLAI